MNQYFDDPRKNGQIRKEPTTRPAGLSDLGVLKGFGRDPSPATLDWYSGDPYAGNMLAAPVTDQFFDKTGVQTGFGGLQPRPEGYTAPIDQDARAREMRLAQMGYDPRTGVARPADALLSGMFKAPDTAGMFVRSGFEDDPNFQMAAVPSGMAALVVYRGSLVVLNGIGPKSLLYRLQDAHLYQNACRYRSPTKLL